MFKIAFRNIFRQKRRTILTMLTMFGGFALSSISIGYADGTYSYIIDLFTRNRLGHIQVHKGDYLDRPSLYKTIAEYQDIGEKLLSVDRVEQWTPRVYSAGITLVDEKSAGTRIIGIDPAREVQTTHFKSQVSEGRYYSGPEAKEVLLGKGLAKILNASVGDSAILVSQAADGSIANDIYRVIGLVESGDTFSDRAAFYLPLAVTQELLVLTDQAHELVVVADNTDDLWELSETIAAAIDDSSMEVSPWMEFAKMFYNAMRADIQGMWIFLFVIILIVAIGVLNTVLMSVLERTREYGVLRALGTRPGEIFRMVLSEVSILAAFSVIIGAALGLAVNLYLSAYGFTIPEPITYGGVEFTTMYGEANLRSVYIPAITVVFTALFVSVFPALKAARIEPARAMRMH